jgi:hypothetical protein
MFEIDCVPEVSSVPLQPPEAVQEVASVEDQVSVLLPPEETDVGLAERVTVGAGGDVITETDADCAADPPAPLQVRV